MTDYQLGRRPPKNAPALMAAAILRPEAPRHPLAADFMMGVEFGLDGNDKYGVCGPTSCDNYCRAVSAILAGKSLPWTQDEVFALYRLNNPDFDPSTGAGDEGVDMQTMLELWHKHGAGHDENGKPIKPVAFAKVDPKNDGELDAAASVCGGILWGATLQVAQQAQSDADPPEWDYQDSGPWGGHAVYHGGYVEATRLDHVVSWAKDVAVTARFRYEQLDEAWMVILPWHVKHPEFHKAIDLDALAATYKALTGRDLAGA